MYYECKILALLTKIFAMRNYLLNTLHRVKVRKRNNASKQIY